jgi:hypothetical protein
MISSLWFIAVDGEELQHPATSISSINSLNIDLRMTWNDETFAQNGQPSRSMEN